MLVKINLQPFLLLKYSKYRKPGKMDPIQMSKILINTNNCWFTSKDIFLNYSDLNLHRNF